VLTPGFINYQQLRYTCLEMATPRSSILVLAVATISLCVIAFFAAPRLFDRQEQTMFRYKVARQTTGVVVKKEHRVNANAGPNCKMVVMVGDTCEWVVLYRVTEFPIYFFYRSKTGDFQQGSIDSRTTQTLNVAEQRRAQQSGSREWMMSQKEYDSLAIGDRLDVSYRLRADDESVEIMNVELVNP